MRKLYYFLWAVILLFSCKKEKDQSYEVSAQGRVYIAATNKGMENAKILIYGVRLETQTSFRFDPFDPLDDPFSQYPVQRTEIVASTYTDEDGNYEIFFNGDHDHYFMRVDEKTITNYDFLECATFDLEKDSYALSGTHMEANYRGFLKRSLFIHLSDSLCQDNSVLKNFSIGYYKEDGTKENTIVVEGDRYCDTLEFYSNVFAPGFVEWTIERNGQTYYEMDSIPEITNCDEGEYIVKY